MIYNVTNPSTELTPFIKQYWALDNCLPEGEKHIQRIVPSGLLELIFYFGNKPKSGDAQKSVNENTLITGQLSEYYDIQLSGNISLFSIIFQPHGLSSFLDIPISELYNQNVPVKYVFKKDINEIENKLFEAKSFDERVNVMNHYFLNLIRNNGIKHSFKRINSSIHKINQTKGCINIDELAAEACYSRKQFGRIFLDMTGTTPKQFLRVIRFQHAISVKSRNQKINLTGLTYQCGYYDQSHMINDFQKLSGMTPRQYFNDCEPYSDYFQ